MRNRRLRILVEAALTIALAWVLNALSAVVRLPFGGDISLEMLPLIVFALRNGVGYGLLAGGTWGALNFLARPTQIVHPAQWVLDYSLAFALVGLAGLFAPVWRRAAERGELMRGVWTAALPAAVLGGSARFLAHFASGIVYFGSYAPKGQPVALYSLLYNGTYMLPATVLCTIGAALLMPALERAVPSDGGR